MIQATQDFRLFRRKNKLPRSSSLFAPTEKLQSVAPTTMGMPEHISVTCQALQVDVASLARSLGDSQSTCFRR